jgi:hypothetical protein
VESPQQKRILEKREREEQELKSKRGETYLKSSMFKKKYDKIYKLLGEILSNERKRGDHIFL